MPPALIWPESDGVIETTDFDVVFELPEVPLAQSVTILIEQVSYIPHTRGLSFPIRCSRVEVGLLCGCWFVDWRCC